MEDSMARLRRVLSAAMVVGASAAMLPVSAHAQTRGASSAPQARPAKTGAPTVTPVVGGAIRGIVRDERGGLIRGAIVSAIGVATAPMASAVTDQDGRFSISALPAGEYMVRAHLTGFTASRRESVRVAGSVAMVPDLQIRRLDAVAGTSGDKPIASRPIVAAGFQLPQPDTADGESGDKADHPHTDLAWRLRHLKRSILKSDSGAVIVAADDNEFEQGSFFGKAFGGAANLATALFTDVPFAGEVNLLTSSAYGTGKLFGNGTALPRGIAYFAIGSPTPAGDWTVRAAMSEGDLASWIVAGSFVSKITADHAYTVGMSYGTQDYSGGNPAALAAIHNGDRNAGEIYGFDRWAVKRWLALDYGSRYARYGYLDAGRGLWSPRVGLTFEPVKGTRLSTLVVQRMVAPGAEEFLPRAMTGPALPPERTFAPFGPNDMRAERARLVDLQLEHDFRGAYVIGVRRFHQNVDDQLVTLFHVSPAGDPESVGHYYVANIGNFDAEGWAVRLSTPATSRRLRGSIDYAVSSARWASRNAEIGEAIPAALRPQTETIHDITGSLHTDIPETSTRFYVVYRINTGFTRAGAVPRPGLDSRFDVQVNQALPFGVAGTKWEVLVGMRNLFRDANDPSSIYDELLVVRPPKRVVGGFLVRF
jgi:hypothetical protein